MLGDQPAGQEGVMLRFRGPKSIEPNRLGGLRDARNVPQADGWKESIKEHGAITLIGSGLSAGAAEMPSETPSLISIPDGHTR